MKNLKNLGKALSKAEQKMINGGIIPPGRCVDSNIDCTNIGNAGCPNPKEGCYILGPDSNEARCQCLKKLVF